MEQVAKMIGVKLDEEFKVNKFNKIFKITKDGMYWRSENADDWIEWLSANHILLDILFGDYEVENPTLTEKERAYLSSVIKPFRNNVISITKLDSEDINEYEYVCIEIKEVCVDRYYINLPYFKKGTMYKGMETDKAYSMEDMGL